jgi:hypothetical protein
MTKRLLVVEDAFLAGGRGVMVTPKITVDGDAAAPIAVNLRRPDGTERAATAALQVAHIRGPLAPFAMVRLVDAGLEDVPVGTEIWTVE